MLLNLNTLIIHTEDSFNTTLKVQSSKISGDYEFSVLQSYEYTLFKPVMEKNM